MAVNWQGWKVNLAAMFKVKTTEGIRISKASQSITND